MIRAEPQFQHFRNFRPAAAGDNAVIDLDRTARGVGGTGRQIGIVAFGMCTVREP
jgi:hypothetical protein